MPALNISTRSWARPWRRKTPDEHDRRGPRITVIGNVQARGVARSLELLLPDARVETLLLADLPGRFGTIDALLRHLAGSDHVMAHGFSNGFVQGGDSRTLVERLAQTRLFPVVTFPGFHPDRVSVADAAVLSPIGEAHSAIALFCFLEGLSVDETLSLYVDPVFERLGYFEMWSRGAEHLLESARALGFDLDQELTAWTRRGCFMHDVGHPKLEILGDLARRLAREAGLSPLDVAVEDYLADDMIEESHWPVFPAVAERCGVAAGSLFRGRAGKGQHPLLIDLPAFIAESFELYRAQPREALVCARLAAWRADPAIVGLFASARRS